MKKILIGLGILLCGGFSQAQNGLENIVVEKYYVSNAADAAGSMGVLPVGSITYRIYVDMLPGYKFQMAYGNTNHNLKFTTTTSFFNNTDYGSTTPSFTKTNAAKNTVMLDSWLSVGAACSGNFGILKSEDNGVNNVVNTNGLLANTDPRAGIPLTTQDGLIAGSPQAVQFVGMDATVPTDNGAAGILGNGSVSGSSFILRGSAWSSLAGATGPTSTNRVLIAQITTDGVFHYELNVQIGTPTGGVQNYVSSNPTMFNGQMELTMASLTGTLNARPTVSITSPSNGAISYTGETVHLTASASDIDGTISSVEFFVDGVSKGITNSAPYAVNWTGTTGTHYIKALATDNEGLTRLSDSVALTTNPYQPTVNLHVLLQGLSDGNGNMLAAIDGNTGFPKWGANVADKIEVELFHENSPYNSTGVKVEGINLSTNGLAVFTTTPLARGNYFIKVTNRNHLEIWSATAVSFNNPSIDYSFLSGSNQAYGTDAMIQVYFSPDRFAMFCGDLNQSGYVDLDDFTIFEPDNTVGNSGFLVTDINGSGYVDLDDFTLLEPRITAGNAAQSPGKRK